MLLLTLVWCPCPLCSYMLRCHQWGYIGWIHKSCWYMFVYINSNTIWWVLFIFHIQTGFSKLLSNISENFVRWSFGNSIINVYDKNGANKEAICININLLKINAEKFSTMCWFCLTNLHCLYRLSWKWHCNDVVMSRQNGFVAKFPKNCDFGQHLRLDNTNHGLQLFWALSIFGRTDGPCQESVFEKKQKHFSAQKKTEGKYTCNRDKGKKFFVANPLWPIGT